MILVFLAVVGVAKGEATPKTVPTTILEKYNTVTLRGAINWNKATYISNKLLEKDASPAGDVIFLVLDSGGGSIMAGNSIIATMRTLKKKVICISMYAASMAHGILQNCFLRYTTEFGISMIHRARGGFQGYFNDGEVESRLGLWKSIVTKMEKNNAERMGYTYEEYKAKAAKEFWCQGRACVEKGFVSYITNLKCSKDLIKSKTRVSNNYGRKLGYLSGCPLLRGIIR